MLPDRVMAFDCETLGINAQYDALTSFAVVEFEDGLPTGNRFERVVLPEFSKLKISIEALNVQGKIFDPKTGKPDREALRVAIDGIFSDEGIPAKQAMAELADWCSGVGAWKVPNVAHHASFDLGFYDQKLACNTSVFRSALSPVWICTKKLAMAAQIKGCSRYGMQETAKLLGIEFDENKCHGAAYDATLCGRVYFGLKALLESPPLEVATA